MASPNDVFDPQMPKEGQGAKAGLDVPLEEDEEARVFIASQWQLVWMRFRRHRLAVVSAVITLFIYTVALFPEFFAPFPPNVMTSEYLYAPPQRIHFFDRQDGRLRFSPYVNGFESYIEPEALRRVYEIDESVKIPIRFFVEGEPYKLLGVFPAKVRLVGPVDKTQPMFLLGGDRLGRDVLSRLIYGTRVSMSIGLIGVVISSFLGILIGGLSGYLGGMLDNIIQRIIEFLRSIPTIPLWMGLAAALPMEWPPLRIYFGITVILSLLGWTGLARIVRGRFMALREEQFIMAAELDGASDLRIIFRYMLPAFTSHMIARTTLAIPSMILSETSLSFLGLGLRPPVVSWGVLLQDAQTVRVVSQNPWLLSPAVVVVITVLVLNFMGDGLRDAANPYG